MENGNVVLIHGFWSSPATWDRIVTRLEADQALSGLRIHRFAYESPKLLMPFSTTRIPDYNDIAQSIPRFLADNAPDGPIAFVTHSQGGLVLQRFLAWMLTQGRARELVRIRVAVLLACPNQGSDFARSIRRMAGFGRHPQARELQTLQSDVADSHRHVLKGIVNATAVTDHSCPIRIHAYAGRTDAVVSRVSGQGFFPNAETLPGNHSTILNPELAGSLTVGTIRDHILEAFSAPAEGAEPTGRGRVVLANTLEAPTGNFTGRSTEIDKVERLVHSERSPIVVIHGMPGVGKSALATYLADRLLAESLRRRGSGGSPIVARLVKLHGLEGADGLVRSDISDELRGLLVDAGFDAQKLPGELDDLAGMWRGYLADKQLLLLVDNAANGREVTPFLPGGYGHVVLVTSRNSLEGLQRSRGARGVLVPVMPADEAAQLFAVIAGRPLTDVERPVVDRLAAFCGYHPLAMTIIAVRLRNRSGLSYAELLAGLASAEAAAMLSPLMKIDEYVDEENGRVATSFDLSYRMLTADGQLLLRRLGLTPVPTISVEVATAVSGLPAATVRAELDRLLSDNLIEQKADGYSLHDLIRYYARGLAERDDAAQNQEAVSRVLAYYVDAARYVDKLLTRQPVPATEDVLAAPVRHRFEDRAGAVTWARAELANLLACADYAAQCQDNRWIIRFSVALAGVLRNEAQWNRSVELQSRAVAAAAALGSPLAEANALHERALLYRLLGMVTEHTLPDLDRAGMLYESVGGPVGDTGRANVLNTYGVVLDQLRRREESRARLEKALELCQANGYRLGEANVRHDQGMNEYFAKRYEAAAGLISQALSLYVQEDQPLGQAHARSNLARAQRQLGRTEEAATNLAAAQDLYHQLGNRLGEANTMVELGVVLRGRGDNAAAVDLLSRAFELQSQVGNQLGRITANRELGVLYGAMGERDLARRLLQETLDLIDRSGLERERDAVLREIEQLGLEPEQREGSPAPNDGR